MTLIQLEYIVAVDNYRHFAKAADSCFVTQPTLSMQIHKLEDQLGVILFDRNKHPVEPTKIGEKILKQARIAILEAKRINELISEEKDEINGELKLGIIPTLSPYLLPLFINDFIEKNPAVNVNIQELTSENLLKQLKNDTIDLGILVTPLVDETILEKPIFYEEFMAYMNHRHTLFNKETLTIEDVQYNDLWILNEGHCFRNQVLNICHPNPIQQKKKNFVFESGSLEGLRKIVDHHGGMTLLPELATLDMSQTQKSKLKRFNDPRPIREVSIVMKESFMKHKMVDALYESISRSIPGYIHSKKNGKVIKWK
ncbi:MAG: hydrogen peroxide-inducible genes activator [Cyclobacteriaceae bacterium]|nr:hydrogen peroxide-inducible genes activator [Cyclobacteriaceae bacterium]